VANLAVRRRRFRFGTLLLALVCLVAAQFVSAIEPRAVPALVAAGVGFAAAGGGLPGLLLAVFGAGLAPLDTPLRIAFGIGALAVFDRASRRDDEAERLTAQSLTDRLTGLHTYAYFSDVLQREVGRVRRYGGHCSLVVFDLDHFKDFNDRYGHPAGDEALKAFANILKECVRDGDVPARYGGEEFAIYLADVNLDGAMAIGERVRSRTESTLISLAPGITDRITVSVGVAAAPLHGTDRVGLLRMADGALYEAKAAGRNRVIAAGIPSAEPPAKHRSRRVAIPGEAAAYTRFLRVASSALRTPRSRSEPSDEMAKNVNPSRAYMPASSGFQSRTPVALPWAFAAAATAAIAAW
jgi:diguanylate cyclase (GGDEF)-like protein